MTDRGVIQLTGQVVPVKLDVEKGEGKTVAQKYGMGGVPLVLLVNEVGIVDVIGGYAPAARFSQLLRAALALPDGRDLESRYKSNPNDFVLIAKMAFSYARRGEVTRANAMIAQVEKLDPRNSSAELLSRSYNALGDVFQSQRNYEQALLLFGKAVKTGKDFYDLNYAHESMASCYSLQHKMTEQIAEWKAIAALPNCPPDVKGQADRMVIYLSRRARR